MNTGKCSNCGSPLKFNSTTGLVECKKCGSVQEVKISKDINRHHIDIKANVIDNVSSEIVSKHCESCGAVFSQDVNSMSNVCDYCGASLVIDFDRYGGLMPDACIPFAFNPKEAANKFMQKIKKMPFVPSKLKKGLQSIIVDSLYIPVYSFDANVTSEYDGRIYRNETDSDGDSRRVYRVIKDTKKVVVKNVMLECSSKFTQAEFNEIKPYDTTQIRKFDKRYIMGYSVENSNRNFNDIRKSAKELIDLRVKNNILSQYDYDGVDYLHIKSAYDEVNYSYLILPTYKVTYELNNKKYLNQINGQTGKIGGKFPISAWKVLGFLLGLIGGMGLFALLILILTRGF